MSAASESLADVRGWLCDNLSEGDAGKVCGMLSAVSRHITRLETENAHLDQKRIGLHAEVDRLSGIIHRQRKQLVDVQDALERRNDEKAKLQDENARLRSCLSDDAENARQIMGENAELRKIVRDMWHDIPKSESCGWDMNTNTCTGSDECIGECSYWYRMRELGIEV